MATATTMKTALKVLYDKVHRTYTKHKQANGNDRVETVTETYLQRMTKLRITIWLVRALRWYRAVPRELYTMKHGMEAWKKRIDQWATRIQTAKNGETT